MRRVRTSSTQDGVRHAGTCVVAASPRQAAKWSPVAADPQGFTGYLKEITAAIAAAKPLGNN